MRLYQSSISADVASIPLQRQPGEGADVAPTAHTHTVVRILVSALRAVNLTSRHHLVNYLGVWAKALPAAGAQDTG